MSCTEVEIAPEYEYVIIYYSNKYANIYTGYICVWVVGSVGSAFSIWNARALLRLLFACSHVQFSENERSVGSGGFDANACVFFVFVFFSFCFLCVFNIDAADGEEKRETYTNARVWTYLLNMHAALTIHSIFQGLSVISAKHARMRGMIYLFATEQSICMFFSFSMNYYCGVFVFNLRTNGKIREKYSDGAHGKSFQNTHQ